MTDKNFYRAFEEKHRGSRELIKSRLKTYLPFVLPFKDIYEECNMLDIGCGRGEWLELMSENGFNATGVDLDNGMLEACKELGLNAINKDALLTLQELPDESLVIVSGFHIAEHLPFETLLEIVKEAKRVLKPAGLLILETPNAENIFVGTFGFYADPTHKKPIYNELLTFMTEYSGYKRNKILRLQEPSELHKRKITIFDIYGGASPDYAVVAQKDADLNLLSLFDNEFSKNYGLSINTLCNRFEEGITNRFDNIEAKAQSAEAKAQSAEAALNAIYASRSWKITAPYRAIGDFTKDSRQKTKNALKPLAAKGVTFINAHPKLRKHTVMALHNFPKIETRLRRFYDGYYKNRNTRDVSSGVTINSDFLPMTAHSQRIFDKLKREIAQRKGAV